ncbi:hypothetical protein CLOM_g10572 [Closterium sp. NIES-68]|nr:hypothetical protein CLOM_g10572 [Closterium sp. NIES-68]
MGGEHARRPCRERFADLESTGESAPHQGPGSFQSQLSDQQWQRGLSARLGSRPSSPDQSRGRSAGRSSTPRERERPHVAGGGQRSQDSPPRSPRSLTRGAEPGPLPPVERHASPSPPPGPPAPPLQPAAEPQPQRPPRAAQAYRGRGSSPGGRPAGSARRGRRGGYDRGAVRSLASSAATLAGILAGVRAPHSVPPQAAPPMQPRPLVPGYTQQPLLPTPHLARAAAPRQSLQGLPSPDAPIQSAPPTGGYTPPEWQPPQLCSSLPLSGPDPALLWPGPRRPDGLGVPTLFSGGVSGPFVPPRRLVVSPTGVEGGQKQRRWEVRNCRWRTPLGRGGCGSGGGLEGCGSLRGCVWIGCRGGSVLRRRRWLKSPYFSACGTRGRRLRRWRG